MVKVRDGAEMDKEDVVAERCLVEGGAVLLCGLIADAGGVGGEDGDWPRDFNDPGCLKMILDWKDIA